MVNSNILHSPSFRMILVSLLLVASSSCADFSSPSTRIDEKPEETTTIEKIEFTTQNYAFTGPTSIADMVAAIPEDDFVWHGFAPQFPYPVQGDCDFDRANEQKVSVSMDLPVTIEGVVTLHPRYFQKRTICNQDERFYASYFIQDGSGGIVVLKDSRVSDFTYGARVKMRVLGLVYNRFGQAALPFRAVLAHDQQEIISTNNPIYYEPVNRNLEVADIGKVVQVKGRIVSEATNSNFNEMKVEALGNPEITWLVSLDRELGQRSPELCAGDTVTLTGPVLDSFGLRLVIASRGQIEFDANACQNK